ncbi:hypothetical protein [Nocardia abscessus]|uniref:hypothetical protein n=1 Tax=Nocardia abscessus TaxID=120957 RepID=UPI0024582F62|nr:hypothetical protein [Nocardia abscessus]
MYPHGRPVFGGGGGGGLGPPPPTTELDHLAVGEPARLPVGQIVDRDEAPE